MTKHGLTEEALFSAGGACTLAEWIGGALGLLARELHKLQLERDRDNASIAETQMRLLAERLRALDPAIERARVEAMNARIAIDPSLVDMYKRTSLEMGKSSCAHPDSNGIHDWKWSDYGAPMCQRCGALSPDIQPQEEAP